MYLPLLRFSFCDYLVRCFVSECLCLGFPSWSVAVSFGLQRNPVSWEPPPSVTPSVGASYTWWLVPWTLADVLRFLLLRLDSKGSQVLPSAHTFDWPYETSRHAVWAVLQKTQVAANWGSLQPLASEALGKESPAVHMEARPFPAGFLNDRWSSTDTLDILLWKILSQRPSCGSWTQCPWDHWYWGFKLLSFEVTCHTAMGNSQPFLFNMFPGKL